MIAGFGCWAFGHRWECTPVPETIARQPGWFFFRCRRCGWHGDAFKAGPGEYVRMPK